MVQAEINFYKRLLAMYGEDQGKIFFKERTGKEAPEDIKPEEPNMFDLNNL